MARLTGLTMSGAARIGASSCEVTLPLGGSAWFAFVAGLALNPLCDFVWSPNAPSPDDVTGRKVLGLDSAVKCSPAIDNAFGYEGFIMKAELRRRFRRALALLICGQWAYLSCPQGKSPRG